MTGSKAWALLLCWGGVIAAGWPGLPEASAQEKERSCEGCVRVDAILVEGIARTRRAVVERELTFEEGDVAHPEDLEESAQRLRNTGLFWTVELEVEAPGLGGITREAIEDVEAADGEPPGRLLRVKVSERWTLAPGFRFGAGGQTFLLSLGLQDINLGGRYLQAGASYSRLGETNSGSLWFQQPRLFGARQRLMTEAAYINRVHTFYGGEGELLGGYLLTRRRASVQLEREWLIWFRTGASTSVYGDTFSFDNVDDRRMEAQLERAGLPGPMQTVRVGGYGLLGRIDQHRQRYEGTRLGVHADQFLHFGAEAPRSYRLSASVRHFTLLPREANLAVRATIATSDQEIEHMQSTAGGLETIRGVPDMRFRGRHMWTSNVELRIPSLRLAWITLEHAFFLDALGTSRFVETLLRPTAATAGTGIRIYSPQVLALLVRADVSAPVMGTEGIMFSFGAGQFF